MADDSCNLEEGGTGANETERKRKHPSLDFETSSRRHKTQELYRNPSKVIIKIISASYGPCEFNALDDSEISSLPFTRDCTSFLLDLLEEVQRREGTTNQREQQDRDKSNGIVRLPPTVNGKIENFVYLLPGVETDEREHVSMNAIFGDPCPGKTKRLHVKYTVTENYGEESRTSPPSALPSTLTEIHRVTFAEHETVKLRRCLTHVMKVMGENDRFEPDELNQVDHGDESIGSGISWKLPPRTSEITLPIILPFLSLWERMQCRLICCCWKNIVQECGVSRSIDVNSAEINARRPSLAEAPGSPYATRRTFTRSMLRGLLANSYASLQSLFLNGFKELRKEDLHPALPSLRNLNVLDISHCMRLDDSTLQLLADPSLPSSTTLRVLYLKGLHEITDVGLMALCNSCSRLEVLDLSHLTNITDQGAQCIKHLIFLRALFLRDNWQLTNESIDAITKSCSKLEQLTLWGCHRLKHLKFDSCTNISSANTSNRLVILNLWGCHGLDDNVAHILSSIPNINCLMVSECHRLSDQFVQILVEGIGQRKQGKGGLRHLHLRYLKKITDNAVIAIALNLPSLLSLDLSFCSKITYTGIYRLLDELRSSLVELRLNHCLSITPQNREGHGRRRQQEQTNNRSSNHAGHWILNALRRRPHSSIDHSLCLLDVRGCGGQPGRNKPYPNEDPFVKGMLALQFEQTVPGFFSRTARSR